MFPQLKEAQRRYAETSLAVLDFLDARDQRALACYEEEIGPITALLPLDEFHVCCVRPARLAAVCAIDRQAIHQSLVPRASSYTDGRRATGIPAALRAWESRSSTISTPHSREASAHGTSSVREGADREDVPRSRHPRTLPGAWAELDRGRREARRRGIQLLIFDKVAVAPIWQNVPLNGVGAKVEESGIGLVAG